MSEAGKVCHCRRPWVAKGNSISLIIAALQVDRERRHSIINVAAVVILKTGSVSILDVKLPAYTNFIPVPRVGFLQGSLDFNLQFPTIIFNTIIHCCLLSINNV